MWACEIRDLVMKRMRERLDEGWEIGRVNSYPRPKAPLVPKFKKGFNASLHKQNALKIVHKYPKIVGW